MAINWDFNEPWPCAAGNSLVNWPAEPKSCLKSVGEALRPTLISLDVAHNRYVTGESFKGDVWLLNDCDEMSETCEADIFLVANGEKTKLKTVSIAPVSARTNAKCDSFEFTVSADIPERFSISIECAERPEISSAYNFVHNTVLTLDDIKAPASIGGNDDFSDFLR